MLHPRHKIQRPAGWPKPEVLAPRKVAKPFARKVEVLTPRLNPRRKVAQEEKLPAPELAVAVIQPAPEDVSEAKAAQIVETVVEPPPPPRQAVPERLIHASRVFRDSTHRTRESGGGKEPKPENVAKPADSNLADAIKPLADAIKPLVDAVVNRPTPMWVFDVLRGPDDRIKSVVATAHFQAGAKPDA